jgi:hypothetical protein
MQQPADLPAKIAALEARIEVVRHEMEAACREFVEAAKPAVASWFERRVEAQILASPEALKTLGREALHALKAELRDLVGRAPRLVEEHVNRDRYWAHRRAVLDDSATMLNLLSNPYGRRGGRQPEIVDRAIADVLGVADGLLARYGFGARDGARAPFEWTGAMHGAPSATPSCSAT